MSRPIVMLTNPIIAEATAMLETEADILIAADTSAEALREAAREADGVIVRAQLPADFFEHAPKVRGVVRHGVGLDFIPVAAATARGVSVANLPGSNTQAVAEYAISMALQLRRPLAAIDAAHRAKGWAAARSMSDEVDEIGGATLGVLGLGMVGRRVAKIAKSGFDMRVIASSRRTGDAPDGVEEVSLDALFAQSDVLVVCCALNDQTRGLVDAARIAAMRPGATLINVARGPVVETEALVAALRDGRLRAAATDVYDAHPAPPHSPLFECPNLLMTPHVAALTEGSARAMGVGSAEEMLRILRGERPLNLVNPEALTTSR